VCALHGSDPISIALEGIGSFRQKHGHTWWVGVQADPELVVLAGALAEALRQIGLAIQRREFQPHITLARGVHSSGPVLLEVPSCEFTVPGISLMRSQHKGDRMVYTELARV
ncbi:MAG: 2'-5' RNA ligase family protein, partial [Coriobacteriales bacterium]|nr:2'-5' RNA ligase family protein [Coriobacteriales bacterium]